MTDKENLHILGNLKVFHVRKILPPVPMPSQMIPVCIIFLWPILIFTQLIVGLPGSIFLAVFFLLKCMHFSFFAMGTDDSACLILLD
jgi:hypothetical protein